LQGEKLWPPIYGELRHDLKRSIVAIAGAGAGGSQRQEEQLYRVAILDRSISENS